MPLGARALRQGQGKQSSEDRRGRDISHGQYTDQPHQAGAALAAGTTGAQILLHQPLQSLPRAVGTCSVLALMGQGTFWCWWVQIQESMQIQQQLGFLPQQESRAELSHKDKSHMCAE